MTALEIINRSIVMHPSLFAEALDAQAQMHMDYLLASPCLSERVRQGVRASISACKLARGYVLDDDAAGLVKQCGPMVIALNVAGRAGTTNPPVGTVTGGVTGGVTTGGVGATYAATARALAALGL